MKLVGSCLCILAILSCVLCQDALIDDDDGDLNLDPTSPRRPETESRIDTSDVVNALQQSVTLLDPVNSETPDCECVLFNLCKDNKLNTNGEGLLNIRQGQRHHCNDLYYVCCPNPGKDVGNNTVINSSVVNNPVDITTVIPLVVNNSTGLATVIPPVVNNTTVITETMPRLSSGCGKRNPEGVGFRIKGNTHNETEFGEFPWMAAIWMADENPPKSNLTVKCAGSLINPKVVMTAGHCVRNKGRQLHLRVRLGEWDLQSTKETIKHQDREVEKVVIHKEYYSGGLHNDIALLFLKTPVELKENVDMICLADSEAKFDRERCIVAGWGALSEVGYGVRFLKQLELPIVPRDVCEKSLQKTPRLGDEFELHESFICAGGVANIDTCKGDGGAPLFCPLPGQFLRYQQVGIVSWGVGCGDLGVPALYTNVPLFRKWVDEQMKLHSVEQNTYNI